MSEAQTQEPAATEVKQEQSAAQAAIDPATIAKLQEDIVARATAEAERIASQKAAQALEAQSKRIKAALGEDDNDGVSDKVLRRFAEDPVAVLQAVSRQTREETEQAVLRRIEERTAKDRESMIAARKVLGARPDIHTNEQAMELVNSFYEKSDPKLKEEERISSAVKQFDLLIEKSGGTKAEERIAAAASPSRTASAQSEGPKAKSQAEVTKDYLARRVEEYAAKHGGQYPSSTRS